MGFTLKLTNAPPAAVLWNANFAENSFSYEPLADSGWLAISQGWDYPSDPLGCTTLRIWAIDANSNILFDYSNLGPVENNGNYTFDCSTAILSGEVKAPISKWLIVVAIIGILLLAKKRK